MQPFDLTRIRTYSLHDRPSKVSINDLGKPIEPDRSVVDWLESLPKQLATMELRKIGNYVRERLLEGRFIAVAIGGHVIKTGCAPYLIDLIRRGVIHAVAMNGSAAIHDFELAYAGKTSEDVASQLQKGEFGMAKETAEIFAEAASWATKNECGLGYALGYLMECDWRCQYADASLLIAARRFNIPCTVHVAIGTDIVHMHPQLNGAALGASAHYDFRLLCSIIANMYRGIWFNLGSAVVMPEVFLKAVAVAKNCKIKLDDFITINFDKESRYRTAMNVLQRPGAVGIEIIGHHELLIPLLYAVIINSVNIDSKNEKFNSIKLATRN